MKKPLQICYAVLFIGVLFSCNLSKYPIDDPASVKIDSRLVGKWKLKGDKHTLFNLTRQNDYHYQVKVNEWKKAKPELYTAFLSQLNNTLFLNIRSKDDTPIAYLFLKVMDIAADGNHIITATVSDSTMQYLISVAQVRERILKNINNPAFYSDTGYLYRVR